MSVTGRRDHDVARGVDHDVTGDVVSAVPDPGGGGFVFDPAVVDGLLAEWQEITDDITKDAGYARALLDMKPPADEWASRYLTDTVKWSAHAFIEHSNQMWQTADVFVTNLRHARDAYLVHDDASMNTFKGNQP